MVLRPFAVAGLPAVAWKNGQGRARELAVSPPGTDVCAFDWRVTVADLEPGATTFSRFPAVERVLVPTGPGLRLGPAGCGGAVMREAEPWVPIRFDGTEPLDARLVGAPIRAFNAMARRSRLRAHVAVHRATAALPSGVAAVLWCVQGQARIEADGAAPVPLATGHAVVLEPLGPGRLAVDDASEALVLVASFRRHPT